MKIFKQNITLFLLLLSVVSFNGMEFFHHHENGAANDDNKCSACLFSSVLNTADFAASDILSTPIVSYNDYILQENTFPIFEIPGTTPGRSPPPLFA